MKSFDEYLEEVGFHINNGGITFKGEYSEQGYPVISIDASHFGIKTNEMKIVTNKESIRILIQDLNKFYNGIPDDIDYGRIPIARANDERMSSGSN